VAMGDKGLAFQPPWNQMLN